MNNGQQEDITRIDLKVVLSLLIVAAALLGGMGAGLARLGWQMDSLSRSSILIHGPLMISGFLGTLICLERAVALVARYRWSVVVPVVNALGTMALLLWRDVTLAKALLTLGSLGLLGLFVLMLRLHPSRDIVIMAAGALVWVIGNVMWLGGEPVFQVVHLWTAFLILTIVGERLELSRIRRLTHTAEYLLIVSVVIYLAGVLLTAVNLDAGIRLLGAGAVAMAIWLLRYDIARRTIRQTGLPRYVAACLLPGYVWLGFGGLAGVWKGAVYAGPDYAVILHAFLLGFVFSMIFGHMPIILPAITGLRLKYTPLFYVHLMMLHVTLIYRIAGNLAQDFTIRRQGGLLNVSAVLLFLAVTVFTVLRSNRSRSQEEPRFS
jgi:hypothetical protein